MDPVGPKSTGVQKRWGEGCSDVRDPMLQGFGAIFVLEIGIISAARGSEMCYGCRARSRRRSGPAMNSREKSILLQREMESQPGRGRFI